MSEIVEYNQLTVNSRGAVLLILYNRIAPHVHMSAIS